MEKFKFFLVSIVTFSTLDAQQTLTFDTELQGFTAAANATSVEWSANHGGSMKLTADGGWAGQICTVNLPSISTEFWDELQLALQNGGTLTFDAIVTGSEQILEGDLSPNWFELVVIGNSSGANQDPPGTGGWDQNIISLGIGGGSWPLSPDTQTINVELPIRTTPDISNDGQLWFDVTPGWSQLVIGTNNQGDSTSEAVIYIDNLTITSFSATPSEWPGGKTYTTDFSSSLTPFWNLAGWTAVNLPNPPTSMTANQNDQSLFGIGALIGDSGGAQTDGYYFNPDTSTASMASTGTAFTTPLPSIQAPTDLSSLDSRFGGKWLQSLPAPNRDGKATLSFTDLPPHQGLDIDFVLGAFDTIDTDDWFGNTATDQLPNSNGESFNFRITVDGVTVHENGFNNSGTYAGGTPEDIILLGSQLNFSGQYRENWGFDNSGAQPTNIDDRHAIPWAQDSVYNFDNLFDDGTKKIPHTAETVTIVFEHAFNGGWGAGYQDEGISLDGVSLHLIGGAPPTLKITKLAYDQAKNTLRLTWNSEPGKNYSIFWSQDLNDWGRELVDDIASQGETTSYPALEEPAITSPIAPNGKIFLRIQENN